MTEHNDLVADLLPEWRSFLDVVARRAPEQGSACTAWTTRDIVAHQAGNAVELGRVLLAHLDRRPVPRTRSFEEREPPFHAMNDDERLAALDQAVTDLARVLERGLDEPENWVPWTGRRMKVAWFGEHMRSELILHRWDLVGDDLISTTQLDQSWMTTHSVDAVGTPLLRRGATQLAHHEPFTARVRVPDQPDVLLIGGEHPEIHVTSSEGDADLTTDAAARVLLLWGRQPADSSRLSSTVGAQRLGRLRTMLSGY